MPNEFFEDVRQFFPRYLSPGQTKELYEALEQFPDIPNFYSSPTDESAELLQGDGWRGFLVGKFDTREYKETSGIILSNSCDIETGNRSNLPRQILFAPIVALSDYEALLRSAGLDDTRLGGVLSSIRAQKTFDIFYLPADQYWNTECVVFLDDVHPHPLSHFVEKSRSRLFRLRQASFYVFLVKLSIHFCRIQEGVARFPVSGQTATPEP